MGSGIRSQGKRLPVALQGFFQVAKKNKTGSEIGIGLGIIGARFQRRLEVPVRLIPYTLGLKRLPKAIMRLR